MSIYKVNLFIFKVIAATSNKEFMYLKVTLSNDFELYLNLLEITAWRPYNGKVDPADLQGCVIVDLTSGGNFRLNKESSARFMALFESKVLPGFLEQGLSAL
jgi:hypothetical protein